jgi:hypothetical protein
VHNRAGESGPVAPRPPGSGTGVRRPPSGRVLERHVNPAAQYGSRWAATPANLSWAETSESDRSKPVPRDPMRVRPFGSSLTVIRRTSRGSRGRRRVRPRLSRMRVGDTPCFPTSGRCRLPFNRPTPHPLGRVRGERKNPGNGHAGYRPESEACVLRRRGPRGRTGGDREARHRVPKSPDGGAESHPFGISPRRRIRCGNERERPTSHGPKTSRGNPRAEGYADGERVTEIGTRLPLKATEKERENRIADPISGRPRERRPELQSRKWRQPSLRTVGATEGTRRAKNQGPAAPSQKGRGGRRSGPSRSLRGGPPRGGSDPSCGGPA